MALDGVHGRRGWIVGLVCVALLAAEATVGRATAGQPYHPPGAALGFGDATRFDRLQSSKQNPAGSVAATRRGVRMGIAGFGLAYEFGDVDSFIDRYEDVGDDLDDLRELTASFGDLDLEDADDNDDLDALLDLVDGVQRVELSVNDLLDTIADEGYLALGATGHFLPFPFEVTHDALRGAVTVDLEFGFRGHLSVLRGDVLQSPFSGLSSDRDDYTVESDCSGHNAAFCVDEDGKLFDAEEEEVDLDAEFSLEETGGLIHAAQTRTLAVGYGTAVHWNRHGYLFAGGRLTHNRVSLSRVGVAFDDDAADTLLDEYSDNRRTESDVGADLGVMWVGHRYRIGGSLKNLVEPSFDYEAIPEDCQGSSGCELLNAHVERGNVERQKTYTMERQLTLEGAVHSPDGRWLVGMAVDVNEIDGPFGEDFNDAYQWLTLGASFESPLVWSPSWRVGYRQNLAGSELRYISGGVTVLDTLSLDLAVSTDTVGSTPRGGMLNVGLETAF